MKHLFRPTEFIVRLSLIRRCFGTQVSVSTQEYPLELKLAVNIWKKTRVDKHLSCNVFPKFLLLLSATPVFFAHTSLRNIPYPPDFICYSVEYVASLDLRACLQAKDRMSTWSRPTNFFKQAVGDLYQQPRMELLVLNVSPDGIRSCWKLSIQRRLKRLLKITGASSCMKIILVPLSICSNCIVVVSPSLRNHSVPPNPLANIYAQGLCNF